MVTDVTPGIDRALANLQLRRQERTALAPHLTSERLFTTFTPAPVLLTVALWTAAYVVLQNGDQYAMRLLMRWVSLFRLGEIFDVDLFAPHVIYRIYRLIVVALLIAASLKALLTVARLVLSFALITDERLVLVESYLVYRRVDEFPLSRVARITIKDSVLHRLLGLGTVEISTSDHVTSRRFGPLGRFGQFRVTLSNAVGRTCA